MTPAKRAQLEEQLRIVVRQAVQDDGATDEDVAAVLASAEAEARAVAIEAREEAARRDDEWTFRRRGVEALSGIAASLATIARFYSPGAPGVLPENLSSTTILKRSIFAMLDAVEDAQFDDLVALAGAAKVVILSFGWLDEFNARVKP